MVFSFKKVPLLLLKPHLSYFEKDSAADEPIEMRVSFTLDVINSPFFPFLFFLNLFIHFHRKRNMSLNKKQSLLQRPKKYTSRENTKNDIEEQRVDTENDGLLSQVIEMGTDNWEPKSNNISKSTTFKPVKA
jgi:hypothetical protein